MSEDKTYSTREFTKILLHNGFKFERSSGGHKHYRRRNERVTINNKINHMIARRLIKEHELNTEV